MKEVSVYDFLTQTIGLSDEEYDEWQRLTHSMTTSARMMGLIENDLTRNVFQSALKNLMDFEKTHNMQFYELGVSLTNIQLSMTK